MSIPEGEGGLGPGASNAPATTAYRSAPLPEAPPLARRPLRAALLTLAWVAGAFVPIPLAGVDGEVAREFLRANPSQGVAPEGPLVPLFGMSLSALVTVRAALALFAHRGDAERRRRWSRRGAAFYFVCAAAQGFSIALWLEYARLDDGIPIVSTPGWGVRLGAVAASMVSAALAWQLANAITRTRVAHGPMLMLLASMTLHLTRGWTALGRDVARDAAPFTSLVTIAVNVTPTELLRVALWRWSPRVWPRRLVREVEAQGPFDLLAIVVDDRIHSAPVVMQEIDGGNAVITMGSGDNGAAMRSARPRGGAHDGIARWPLGAGSVARRDRRIDLGTRSVIPSSGRGESIHDACSQKPLRSDVCARAWPSRCVTRAPTKRSRGGARGASRSRRSATGTSAPRPPGRSRSRARSSASSAATTWSRSTSSTRCARPRRPCASSCSPRGRAPARSSRRG